jgi:predicted anti-sigma-YlaC factor YlaD
MSEHLHKHTRQLLAAARVEGISDAEQAWLETHMQECVQCGEYASSLERTIRGVRSLAAPPDPALVETTRRRVHFRARELREHEARTRALWLSCALSWILGAFSAPLLWRGFEWIGHRIALPDLVWQTGFLLWWFVPAAVVGAVFVGHRAHTSSENGYAAVWPRWASENKREGRVSAWPTSSDL